MRTSALPPLALVFLLALPGCAAKRDRLTATERESLSRLIDRMEERLGLMEDVARWKWNEQRPISDPEREQALLEAISRRAKEHGLDDELVRAFFRAQIEAAKVVQEDCFRRWKEEKAGRFEIKRDLKALRAEIDRLNDDLLTALADVVPQRTVPAVRRELRRCEKESTGEPMEVALRPLLSP